MIVEFFGPPGAGKTTIARALLQRLREHGYMSEIALIHKPDKIPFYDPGGIMHALGRMLRAIIDIFTMALHPVRHQVTFLIAAKLITTLPPKNVLWFVRVSQYILRLSKSWQRVSDTEPIVIFDQAFIQAVCSLAVFNRTVNDAALARALTLIPQSDIAIYVKVDAETQRIRIRGRVGSEPVAARLLEASQTTNLRFSPVVERASAVLAKQGHSVVAVELDSLSSIDRVLDEIEQSIVAKLAGSRAAMEIAEFEKAGEKCLVCESGIPTAAFPLLAAASPDNPHPSEDQIASKSGVTFAWASIGALATYIGGAGLTCAVQFVIARMLHAQGYGICSYVWAWVSLLSYGATLGFIAFVLRFAPAYRAAEQWSLMYGSLLFAVSRSLAAALAAASVGLLIISLRWKQLDPQFAICMAIGMATIPLITLHLVGAGIVRVFGGFIAAILPERVFRDGFLLVIIAFTVYGTLWPLNAVVVLIGSFVSSAATLAFVAYGVFTRWPQQIKNVRATYLPHDWWAFAFPAMTMIGLEIIMTRTGVLVLGWVGSIPEVGRFALAFNLAMLVQLSRAAVSIYFSPTASELHARGDVTGLEVLFGRATVLSLAGGAMLALPVLLFTAPLLHLFGADYASDTRLAQILVIGQLIAAAAGPQQNLLTMTGHERSAAAIMLVFTTITVASCAIAALEYGAIGAAIVTSGTLVAWNVVMAIYIQLRLGLKPGLVLALTRFWPLPASDGAIKRQAVE